MSANRSTPLWEAEDFPWSLDMRNVEQLGFVKEGIIDSASRYKIELPGETLAWLEQHRGHYKYYVHRETKDARPLLSQAKYLEMSSPELEAAILAKHTRNPFPPLQWWVPIYQHTNKLQKTSSKNMALPCYYR
jgi:hypothetical protein